MTHFIENGRVIDPLRRIDAKLNLLLENGKIACLTREKLPADETTDASGLVVCPGFIDLHGHEDPVKDGIRYADEQRANLACLLRMGVTTCLAGNCGDNFCDPSEFLDLIDREGCFVNVAMLAGYTYFVTGSRLRPIMNRPPPQNGRESQPPFEKRWKPDAQGSPLGWSMCPV